MTFSQHTKKTFEKKWKWNKILIHDQPTPANHSDLTSRPQPQTDYYF